jgi:hypothetical protein
LKKPGESHDIPQMKAKNYGLKKTIKRKTTKQMREGKEVRRMRLENFLIQSSSFNVKEDGK